MYASGMSFLLARENRRGCRGEIAGQTLQERNNIGLFLSREPKWPHEVGTAWAIDTAMIIVLDDLLECRQRAIVHVWRTARDLAQARRLEGVFHFDDARDELAASGVVTGQANILEAIVGEVPAFVTRRALR